MPKPGVYPITEPRNRNRAEVKVWEALVRTLPPGWFAWHSLKMLAHPHRSDGRVLPGRREGEGDFVVAIPGKGILVLEVKGGWIEERDGRFFQNGHMMFGAPRDQAHRTADILRDSFGRKGGRELPYIAIATVFPETPFERPPSNGDLRDTLLGAQDLELIGPRLAELSNDLFVPNGAARETWWIDRLHELWGETWVPRLVPGRRSRLREQELVELDEDQLARLDEWQDNPRLCVMGGPGTGKTLVACELYRRLERAGRKPLFLCWTRGLATWLRDEGIEAAATVREHALALLAKAGVAPEPKGPEEEWSHGDWELVAMQAAMDGAGAVPSEHDFVIVDEGQDFSSNDWELVRKIVGEGPLWIFADPGQSYWEDRQIPADLSVPRVKLLRAYRCPDRLARFAELYRDGGPTDFVDAGVELELVVDDDPISAIGRKLLSLAKGQVAPEDIAVLALRGLRASELASRTELGPFRVVRVDDEEADTNVVADTFLRFKGLERPYVIVSELAPERRKYDVRMHIALTRATVGCVIVATPAEVERDPRLAALVAR
ncbi:MAG: AAA family ATPase [Polyangiales bacterium]